MNDTINYTNNRIANGQLKSFIKKTLSTLNNNKTNEFYQLKYEIDHNHEKEHSCKLIITAIYTQLSIIYKKTYKFIKNFFNNNYLGFPSNVIDLILSYCINDDAFIKLDINMNFSENYPFSELHTFSFNSVFYTIPLKKKYSNISINNYYNNIITNFNSKIEELYLDYHNVGCTCTANTIFELNCDFFNKLNHYNNIFNYHELIDNKFKNIAISYKNFYNIKKIYNKKRKLLIDKNTIVNVEYNNLDSNSIKIKELLNNFEKNINKSYSDHGHYYLVNILISYIYILYI